MNCRNKKRNGIAISKKKHCVLAVDDFLHLWRRVRDALALKLQKLLDIPAEYWMRVQVYNDLFIERNKGLEAALDPSYSF